MLDMLIQAAARNYLDHETYDGEYGPNSCESAWRFAVNAHVHSLDQALETLREIPRMEVFWRAEGDFNLLRALKEVLESPSDGADNDVLRQVRAAIEAASNVDYETHYAERRASLHQRDLAAHPA